jgi:hypothetical protein
MLARRRHAVARICAHGWNWVWWIQGQWGKPVEPHGPRGRLGLGLGHRSARVRTRVRVRALRHPRLRTLLAAAVGET